MKNNQVKNWTIIVLFSCLIFGLGTMSLFCDNLRDTSELENRHLADFPQFSKKKFIEGSYFQDISDFYADHFFQREKLLLVSKTIESYKGIQGFNQVEIVIASTDDSKEEVLPVAQLRDAKMYQEEDKKLITVYDLNQRVYNFASKQIQQFTSIQPIEVEEVDRDTVLEQLAITDDQTVEGERRNSLLIIEDTIYEIFGYSEKSCDYYASSINQFSEVLGSDVAIYSMVVPSQIEFLRSQKYRSLADSQADAINIINQALSESVTPVQIYNVLGEHRDEYLYFRSDHHWTALGAYYAYSVFADLIGDNPYSLEDFEKTEIEGFLGYLYNKNFNRNVKNNPDTVEIYHPFVKSDYMITTQGNRRLSLDLINMNYAKKSNKYMVFLSGDNPLAVIDTELDNGRKILVFKDSYGNAFIPYLTSHYDEIHVIDPRHYNQGAISYIQTQGIDEVLFINSSVLISSNKSFANHIRRVAY